VRWWKEDGRRRGRRLKAGSDLNPIFDADLHDLFLCLELKWPGRRRRNGRRGEGGKMEIKEEE